MLSSPPGSQDQRIRPSAPAPATSIGSADTGALDRLTRLAAWSLGSPIAFVAGQAKHGWTVRSCYGMQEESGTGPALPAALLMRTLLEDAPVAIEEWHAHPATRGQPPPAGLGTCAVLSVPLRASTGHPIGALCVVHDDVRSWVERDIAILVDLAAAASVELHSREEAANHRALYELNPFPMWVFDRETLAFLSVNEAAVEHYGYSREEFLRMTILDIRVPDDARALRAELAAGISEGRQNRIWHHRRKDGSFIDVELVTHDLEFHGRPARFVFADDVTLRERSEDRYRQLVEMAHEGIWAVDAVGVTSYANARLCEMLGYRADELAGRPLFDFLEPDSAFEARTLFARRQRGIADVQEISLRRRDGTTFIALASASPLTQDGVFAGALMMLTDITERRRVEDALRESQALLAAAEELAHTGSWAINLADNAVVWSDQLYRVVGLERAGAPITRDVFMALVHPEDRALLERELERLIRTGDADSIQIRIVRPDGELRTLQARGRVHRNAAGRVVRILGSIQDVTDRVAATAEIERANRRLAALVNDAPLAIATIDRQGHVSSWNPAAERLFGWTADEVLGRPVPTIPPEREVEFREILQRRLTHQGILGIETQRLRKDGTRVDVEVATAPVRDASGAIVGGMGFFIDVTGRKQLEEQLRQAQKIEAVGQLAGGIAHDFNNIITAIKLHSEFLLESIVTDDPRREDVQEVSKAAIRAAGLTRQLLAFSRKQLLQPVVLDLNATVRELQTMVSRLIGEDIAVEASLAADLWPVLADAGQVEQVLINLAVNARDAMPGGGRISIGTENVELTGDYTDADPVVANGRHVRLTVGDTGCGMTREVQARLFEPFFTTKGPRGGTGLGLSTVYGIVKQSNGFIAVKSAPDEGTVFSIYLPAAETTPARPAEGAVAGSTERGSEVVLLVEDEEAVRALVRRILSRQGYVVLEAVDGRDALNVTARHDGRIDLVVTDAVMPEMGGLDLIRAMRVLRPDVKVLLMSGYTDDEMTRRGILTPELAFLSKPFDVEALLRRVREVLDARPTPLPIG